LSVHYESCSNDAGKGPKPDLSGIEKVQVPATVDAELDKKITEFYKKKNHETFKISTQSDWENIRHPITGIVLGRVRKIYSVEKPEESGDFFGRKVTNFNPKDPENNDVCVIRTICIMQEYVGSKYVDEVSWTSSDMDEALRNKSAECGRMYCDKTADTNAILCSKAKQ